MNRIESPDIVDPRDKWSIGQWKEEAQSWNGKRRTIVLLVSKDLRKANGNEEKLSRRLKLVESAQLATDTETREFMLDILGLSDRAYRRMCEALGATFGYQYVN